ncbi:hypothetical protein ACFS07_11965 [Undibacterium arcticum]
MYSMKTVFAKEHGLLLTPANIFRRGIADRLESVDRGLGQVCDPDPARGQSRRGRHHGADGAGAGLGRQVLALVFLSHGDGPVRRRAVFMATA